MNKLIEYIELLTKYGESDITRRFLEVHKNDDKFIERARKLNKLMETLNE